MDNSMAHTRGKGGWDEVGEGRVSRVQMVMDGDLTLGGEHTIQCTHDELWNCISENCILSIISVILIHSTKMFLNIKKISTVFSINALNKHYWRVKPLQDSAAPAAKGPTLFQG